VIDVFQAGFSVSEYISDLHSMRGYDGPFIGAKQPAPAASQLDPKSEGWYRLRSRKQLSKKVRAGLVQEDGDGGWGKGKADFAAYQEYHPSVDTQSGLDIDEVHLQSALKMARAHYSSESLVWAGGSR
jgi:hypothetical protein